MKILALEFSSTQRSAAVVIVDTAKRSLATSEALESGPKVNSLALIEEALKEAALEREQIDCVAVGIGPGSYTGIRSAIALAQGWQLARQCRLIGISSAECIAATAQQEGLTGIVDVVIDAQRQEFYLGRYEVTAQAIKEIGPLRIVTMTEMQGRKTSDELTIGPEVTRWFPGGRTVFPRACVLGKMATRRTDFVAGEKLEPIYLREPNFVKAPPPRFARHD
jgi:tRNA threonylcarbamoyl adenosine modification protein YeaZ